MTRAEVLKEFYATPSVPGGASDRMADEIVRLRGELRDMHTKVFHLEEKLAWTERERDQLTSLPAERILAALREPSDDLIDAASRAFTTAMTGDGDWYAGDQWGSIAKALAAAVTTAEREASRDQS